MSSQPSPPAVWFDDLTKVTLSTETIVNGSSVAKRQLNRVWQEVRAKSVEVALAVGCDALQDFAANHCIYIGAINYEREIFEDDEGSTIELQDSDPFSSTPWTPSLGKPRREPQVVGLIYLTPSNFTGEANIGVAVLPEYRGNGLGLAAARKILQWAFEEAGYHRVQAAIMSSPQRDNAMRLFARALFVHEGIRRRQIYSTVSLEYKDVTYMGLVDTDWTIRKYRSDIPWSAWDELLSRHQREREELLELESIKAPLKRTVSVETLKSKGKGKPEVMLVDEGERMKKRSKPSTTRTKYDLDSSRAVIFKFDDRKNQDSTFSSDTDSDSDSNSLDFTSSSGWTDVSPQGDPQRHDWGVGSESDDAISYLDEPPASSADNGSTTNILDQENGSVTGSSPPPSEVSGSSWENVGEHNHYEMTTEHTATVGIWENEPISEWTVDVARGASAGESLKTQSNSHNQTLLQALMKKD